MLSYPLAREFAHNVMSSLKRYAHLKSSHRTTMVCMADLGVNLTLLQGIHQIDLRGDISGFLSYHPKSLLTYIHHFDMFDPIFPFMDRAQSIFHLQNAAKYDQSRMSQQTICHHRSKSWTFSVSWGYSVHIYEKIMPRSWIQSPIETFKPWQNSPNPPGYMFDVRSTSRDPCEASHVFFFNSVERTPKNEIVTTYTRA
uniref:Uncharacterized protein n=1 Tax=Solanum lycopersicum TaxID=4081 RepID=K4D9F8_SOLLC